MSNQLIGITVVSKILGFPQANPTSKQGKLNKANILKILADADISSYDVNNIKMFPEDEINFNVAKLQDAARKMMPKPKATKVVYKAKSQVYPNTEEPDLIIALRPTFQALRTQIDSVIEGLDDQIEGITTAQKNTYSTIVAIANKLEAAVQRVSRIETEIIAHHHATLANVNKEVQLAVELVMKDRDETLGEALKDLKQTVNYLANSILKGTKE